MSSAFTSILTNKAIGSGTYYDHLGRFALGLTTARDPQFQDRVLSETRAFLKQKTLGVFNQVMQGR